jgi:CBS domain containing-hemolysin-like protein
MRKLSVYTIEDIDHLVKPSEFSSTTLQSPALSIFTDFKHSAPMVLDADTPALEALDMLQHEHSSLKLVVDHREELVGLISTKQLTPQNVMQHVSKDVKAKDLVVADLMRPRDQIIGLSYEQIEHCCIGDVLHTLQHNGEEFCVVIDRESHHIRGVISAQDIANRLHIAPVQIQPNPTFLHIFERMYA